MKTRERLVTSIHCLGPVDPFHAYGTPPQRVSMERDQIYHSSPARPRKLSGYVHVIIRSARLVALRHYRVPC
jgi:hypothetical protein